MLFSSALILCLDKLYLISVFLAVGGNVLFFFRNVPKGYNQLYVTPLYDVLNKINIPTQCYPAQPRQDESRCIEIYVRLA